MPSYHAFGLVIAADRPIPPLAPAGGSPSPDVTVTLSRSAPWPRAGGDETECHRSPATPDGESFRVARSRGDAFRFVYSDGVEFRVDADGRRVHGRWPDDMSRADAIEYLLGPILAFVLRLRGVVCLHAAAVAVDDGCFAVLAPAGHGKSTSAAACARRGWPVITEDLLALAPREGAFEALPAYPRVRLWPDAVAGIFGSDDALPRITPDNDAWDKRYLDLSVEPFAFAGEPLPLRAIYTHERRPGPEADFERLSAAEALVALLANVYTRWQPEREQRAYEFELLERLAATVPVKRFRGPYGLEHVDANVAALGADCRRAAAVAAGAVDVADGG